MSYFCGNQQNTSSAAWRGWLCRGAFEGALQALATEGASSFLGDTSCIVKNLDMPVLSGAFGRGPEAQESGIRHEGRGSWRGIWYKKL